MARLRNKVIWITGASSGIGLEMAKQLSANGNDIILSSRRAEVLRAVQRELSFPERSMIVPLDMEQPDTFAEAVHQVHERFGRIDLLVHNAGLSQRAYVVETSLQTDRKLMEVNYMGTIALTKAVLPHMLKCGNGHFAVVTSMVGKFGYGVRSAYSASKHALHGFFESLMIELEDQGIKVTIICPGPVQTKISVNAIDGQGRPTGVMDEMQKKGMPVHTAVSRMISAIELEKREVLVGNLKARSAVLIKALAPALFFNMAKKQNPKGPVK